MKILKYILLLFCVWSVGNVSAQTLSEAEKEYASGNYAEAVKGFEAVAEKDGTSAALLYDIANCYCNLGQWGLGRLYMERAFRLDPGNSRIKTNLTYIASKVDDSNLASMQGKRGTVTPDDDGFIGSFRKAVAENHTSDYWSLFAAMAFILTIASVALYLFSSNVGARKVGFFGGLLFIGFCGVFLAFAFMARSQAQRHDQGVVTTYKTELLTEPNPSSKPSSSPVNQGTKMKVVAEEADLEGNVAWYKVRLNSSYTGWISASDFTII